MKRKTQGGGRGNGEERHRYTEESNRCFACMCLCKWSALLCVLTDAVEMPPLVDQFRQRDENLLQA